MDYQIWTDGAFSKLNDSTGGIAFVILNSECNEIFSYSKTFRKTTNNRMELLAVIIALESIKIPSDIEIFSDSQYVVSTINLGWKRNKNKDLWKRIDKAIQFHKNVVLTWVRGHNNNEYNNKCDKLAVKASQI